MDRLHAFWQDQQGGTATVMAVGLTVGFAVAAVGIDYARAVGMQQLLWSSADSAVLAAAARLPDADAAQQAALEYVEKNLPSAKYGQALVASDIEVGSWDTEARAFVAQGGPSGDDDDDDDDPVAGSASATAVRVTARFATSNGNAMPTLFASMFGTETLDISASAVAGRAGPPCVLALDPAGPSAMQLSGQAAMETIGCGVQVNSTARPALEIKGRASLDATDICVGGTARDSAGGASPDPNEFCPGMNDPMAGLEPPQFGECDHVDARYNNSRELLQPGVYCGGLDIRGNSDIRLEPGLYVIQDGAFALGGNASVEGSEVTFFLTGSGAVVSFAAGSKIDLTAPTSGAFQGVLFFQDRAFGGTHDWKGRSAANLRGVIYFPAGTLRSNNTNAITPEGSCTVLIARTLEFTGQSGVSIDVTSLGCRGSLAGPYRRSVVLLQ